MVRSTFHGSPIEPIGLHGRHQRTPALRDTTRARCDRPAHLPRPVFERYGAQLNGFDKTVAPRWQMVPHGGRRCVIVTFPDHRVDVRQFTVQCNPDVASVWCRRKRNRILVDIYGESPFLTDLYVRHIPTRSVVGRMELSVKQRRKFKVVFFELHVEGRPHRKHSTSAGSPNIMQMLRDANEKVFRPQIHVEFEPVSSEVATLNVDESLVVTDAKSPLNPMHRVDRRTISDDELLKIEKHARPLIAGRGADVGVILVRARREYNFSGKSSRGSHAGNTLYLADNTTDQLDTLAHELGHWLLRGLGSFVYPEPSSDGKYDHSESKRDLMYRSHPHGRRIRRREADVMNETGIARR